MSRREGVAHGSVYTISDATRWAVDDDRVIVVDERAPAACVLTGREALIWRVLTLPQGGRKLAGFLREAAGLSESDAEQELHAVLDRWTRLGILSRDGGDSG